MKNDRITLPDGSTERPFFRRISLNQWEATIDAPLCAKPGQTHRIFAAYGPTRPAATLKLQTKVNEAQETQLPAPASSREAAATISTPQPAAESKHYGNTKDGVMFE